MELSHEQQAVVSYEGSLLAVNAFAGAGKTTTLHQFALRRPGRKILYLAFNRANVEQAKKKFFGMKNVECKTSHSLARGFFQFDGTKIGDTSTFALQKHFQISEARTEAVMTAIDAFIHSDATSLLPEHIPSTVLDDDVGQFHIEFGLIWKAMIDPRDLRVRIPHDGYLKLAALENKKIHYDYILFDEAQDANPATISWILRQSGKKVFVGDEHQAIYSFRGSVNALDRLPGADRLYLTESYRFGAGIAGRANLLLSQLKKSKKMIVPAGGHISSFSVNRATSHMVLSRTNYSLFDSAVDCAAKKIPYGFVGDFESYRFSEIRDAWSLKNNRRNDIRSSKIKEFRSYLQMTEYAEKYDKKDLLLLRNLVDKHASSVGDLIWLVSQTCVCGSLPNDAVVLSTAHKAKGSEHLSVILANDFYADYGKNEFLDDTANEEVNILYVALTRSIKNLEIPENIKDLLVQLERKKQPSANKGC